MGKPRRDLTLGDLLKQAREAKGESQADIAKKLGISQVAVSKIETSEDRLKSRRVRDIAEAYGISPKRLLESELAA